MPDSFDEDIFSDLVDVDEEIRSFLGFLAELLPGAGLEFRSHADEGIDGNQAAGLDPGVRAALFDRIHGEGGVAGVRLATGGWAYALPVAGFDGVLLCRLAGCDHDLAASPVTAALLENTIALALERQKEAEFVAEKEQFQRQIEILKQQHSKLVEDNYRQFRANQEREKEYARKLESEIVRQTAELREANMRLKESSRLKSEFLANMSHELRTPMNAIIGFTELLSETSLSVEQEEYTRTIGQSADSLLVLINDILDLAKIEAGKLDLDEVVYDLPDLLRNVAAMFRRPAEEKKNIITCDLDPNLPGTVLGDNTRLRQVLVNLVGNAMKFTTNGEVVIRARPVEEKEDEGRVRVRFDVRDTGIGIPKERIEAIFEKFTQADGSTTRKFGGTGLGLSICEQLVRLMQGEISVESEEGQGSTFSFVIPMKPVAGAVADLRDGGRPQATGPASRAADGLRVLLVEDNPVNQRLATIMLKQQGCEVGVAADGLKALEALKKEEFDLVLMDVQMPHLDGMSATRKIREIEADDELRGQYAALNGLTASLPIVGLTAHARKEDEQACYEAGMNGFLTKPIIKKKLLAVLQATPPAGRD